MHQFYGYETSITALFDDSKVLICSRNMVGLVPAYEKTYQRSGEHDEALLSSAKLRDQHS